MAAIAFFTRAVFILPGSHLRLPANGGAGAALRAGSGDHGDHRSDIALAHGALVDLDRKIRASSAAWSRFRAGRVDAQRLRDHRRGMLALTLMRQFRGLGREKKKARLSGLVFRIDRRCALQPSPSGSAASSSRSSRG